MGTVRHSEASSATAKAISSECWDIAVVARS
jgi:hypothetical protein